MKVTVTIDVPDIEGVLFQSEIDALEEMGKKGLEEVERQWKGFAYGKGYPSGQKGTSLGAWRFTLYSEGGSRGLRFLNEAKGIKSGKTYAGYVKKRGHTRLLWRKVFEQIEKKVLPKGIKAFEKAVKQNQGKHRRRVRLDANHAPQGIKAIFEL